MQNTNPLSRAKQLINDITNNFTLQDGDYIELKGSGHKKVKDIFIDYKISKLERDSYPVVVDSNGVIVWIPKLKKSKYDSQNDKKCDIIFKCL